MVKDFKKKRYRNLDGVIDLKVVGWFLTKKGQRKGLRR
ncbi:MAG: hypothetical protein XD42_1115 [Thermodesulfobacterium sp. 37_54]|jgi:hypothetical protein|nr:MAG: hypothetical protein XD42_1115 [Thermodesulfobacterium sp. 37_54]KUK18943.1 MAG: hypothetical protein XD55_0996 [Thermodesulfobacterium commune]MBZ4681508.1 hypothetical protein [Thermodesulfobacterium sp.]KUK38142.1 MAG: hypothetical protein XD67_0549 [Thermodesulfobacterium commune]MDK2861871.1 hypothetical protein [Thermodesulfobacterium sp.]